MARPQLRENPVKLTLYVETTTRDDAQALSKALSTSTSALFAMLIEKHKTELAHVTPIKN